MNSKCGQQAEVFHFDLCHCAIRLVLKVLYFLITNEYDMHLRYKVWSHRMKINENTSVYEQPVFSLQLAFDR